MEASSGSFHPVARGLFYGFVAITIPIYLTVILAILFNRFELVRPVSRASLSSVSLCRFLYILPTMQSVVAMAIFQCLSFVVMAISYERDELRGVCYALSSLHHFLSLVSVCLLGLYPVLVCIKVFRRIWYDRSWLIAPFLLAVTGESRKKSP